MIEAPHSKELVKIFDDYSLEDHSLDMLESDDEGLTISKEIARDITSMASISKRQELTLDQINAGITRLYSDAQSDDIQQMKLRQSVDSVTDAIENQDEDATELPTMDEPKTPKGDGIFDTILGFVGMFIMTPMKSAFGKIGTSLLNGVKSIGGFIGKIFKAPFKLLKGFGGKLFAPIQKVFSFIGKIFKPLKSLMPILKTGGRLAKGIPFIGVIIAAVMSIFDGISGWFKAADISGKSEELLTIGDKVTASIASIISGLTFGFLDVKKTFQFLSSSWETIQVAFKDAVEFVSGLLRGDEATIGKLKDYFSNLITDISGFFTDTYESIKESVTGAFDYVKINLETGFDIVVEFINDLGDMLMRPFEIIRDLGSKLFSKLQDINLTDFIPESLKDSWIVKKVVGMISDEPTNEPKKSITNDYIPNTEVNKDNVSVEPNRRFTIADSVSDMLPVTNLDQSRPSISSASPVYSTIDNTDMRESKSRFVETQKANIKSAEDKKPIIVPQIQTIEKEVPVSSKRVMNINGLGFNLMNTAGAE